MEEATRKAMHQNIPTFNSGSWISGSINAINVIRQYTWMGSNGNPQYAVDTTSGSPAAATSLKKIGMTAVIITRTKVELPTSYKIHLTSSLAWPPCLEWGHYPFFSSSSNRSTIDFLFFKILDPRVILHRLMPYFSAILRWVIP